MIESFEQAIIMYAPTVLMFVTQFVDWFVTLRTFKLLSIKKQVEPVLKEVSDVAGKIETLEKNIKKFEEERFNLAAEIKELRANIVEQNEQAKELRKFLQDISEENIELKAELRRKSNEK